MFSFISMTKEEWTAVGNRVAIEFTPPGLAGLIWLVWNWKIVGNFTEGLEFFTKGFIAIAFVWWNYLRIQHQQTQKHQQTGIAGRVEKIHGELWTIGREMDITRLTMTSIENRLKAVMARLQPGEADELNNLVAAANNHLAMANTAHQNVSQDFEYVTVNTGRDVVPVRIRRPTANN
jgi:hypothetical protein